MDTISTIVGPSIILLQPHVGRFHAQNPDSLLTTVDYRSLSDIDSSTKHGLTKVVYPLTDTRVFYTDYLVLYYYPTYKLKR